LRNNRDTFSVEAATSRWQWSKCMQPAFQLAYEPHLTWLYLSQG